MLNNVFVIKTNCDSGEFEKKINKFLSKLCKDTDTNAAIYELNNSGKEQVEQIFNK
ncbi:hypothetical protein ACFSO7_02810 [Bacillus sp. CGMCC 1.16607]|uniref:hypothetical protein n=1 Tax=Bacillus sp. CGMCC 1.16607 TaxID=3351842 RepID=UPI0036274B18